VGAGLAGLTLALSLSKLGIKATVVEKQTEIAQSRWAILLYPIGMKVFRELGALDEVKSLAMPLKDPQVETVEGEVLATLRTGLLFEDLDFCLAVGPSELREVMRKRVLETGVEVAEGVRFLGSVRDEAKRTVPKASRWGVEVCSRRWTSRT